MAKVKIKKKKTVRILANALVILTALVVFAGGFLVMMELGLVDGEAFSDGDNPFNPFSTRNKPFEDDKLTLLMLGTDGRHQEGGRSDTIMLAFLDMNEKTMSLLSIPRDTRIDIPGRRNMEKVNHAYAYGGAPLVLETLNNYLETEYDRYVTIDFNGFKDVVDILGGVEIDVPRRMYYPAESINLQPGLQTLDGHDALAFTRYRGGPDGDYGRMERQQHFLKELAKQVLGVRNVWTASQLVNTGAELVNTNLTLAEMLYIANAMMDMDVDTMEAATVPGSSRTIGGIWYHEADREEFLNLIDRFSQGLPAVDEELPEDNGEPQ